MAVNLRYGNRADIAQEGHKQVFILVRRPSERGCGATRLEKPALECMCVYPSLGDWLTTPSSHVSSLYLARVLYALFELGLLLEVEKSLCCGDPE